MSIELLILIAIFIVLPLIQQLLERARQPPNLPETAEEEPDYEDWPPRRQPTGEPGLPPRQPVPAPAPLPSPAPRLPELPTMPTPASLRQTLGTRKEWETRHAARPAPHHPANPHRVRRRAISGLRNRDELRRAIVLQTILGPCRAAEWVRQSNGGPGP